MDGTSDGNIDLDGENDSEGAKLSDEGIASEKPAGFVVLRSSFEIDEEASDGDPDGVQDGNSDGDPEGGLDDGLDGGFDGEFD